MSNRIHLEHVPFLPVLMAVWPLLNPGETMDLRTKDPRFPLDFAAWVERNDDVLVLIKSIDRERNLYSALMRKIDDDDEEYEDPEDD